MLCSPNQTTKHAYSAFNRRAHQNLRSVSAEFLNYILRVRSLCVLTWATQSSASAVWVLHRIICKSAPESRSASKSDHTTLVQAYQPQRSPQVRKGYSELSSLCVPLGPLRLRVLL